MVSSTESSRNVILMSDADNKRLSAALRRMEKARDFPHNTTPAARHVQMIAETLAKGEKYAMIDEDPKHVAESLVAVVTGFYEMAIALEEKKRTMVEVAPLQWYETHDGTFIRAETPGGRVFEFLNDSKIAHRKKEAEEQHRRTILSMLRIVPESEETSLPTP